MTEESTMRRLLLIILSVSLLSAADNPKAELNRLQGAWRVVSIEHDGKPSTAAEQVMWVFSGEDLIVEIAGESRPVGTIELAPTGTPRAIDRSFTVATERDSLRLTERGIYRWDGETLWICFGEATRDRPTEFASRPGSRTTLVVLKRAGP
jgi:uncharacterized protein (TIGR03067 family)